MHTNSPSEFLTPKKTSILCFVIQFAVKVLLKVKVSKLWVILLLGAVRVSKNYMYIIYSFLFCLCFHSSLTFFRHWHSSSNPYAMPDIKIIVIVIIFITIICCPASSESFNSFKSNVVKFAFSPHPTTVTSVCVCQKCF